jgi:hypothetical protein
VAPFLVLHPIQRSMGVSRSESISDMGLLKASSKRPMLNEEVLATVEEEDFEEINVKASLDCGNWPMHAIAMAVAAVEAVKVFILV